MVSIGRLKSTNLFAKSFHRLNGPFRPAPAHPRYRLRRFFGFPLARGDWDGRPYRRKTLGTHGTIGRRAATERGPTEYQNPFYQKGAYKA